MGPEPKKYAGLPSKERFIVSKLNTPSVQSSQRSIFGSMRSTKSSLNLKKASPLTKKVLDESDYIHELSGIIKRDYYPDLLPQHDHAALVSPHLNLSNFDSHYTSHDNQSFHRLLEKSNAKRKSRLKFVQQGQLKSLTQGATQGMAHLLLPPDAASQAQPLHLPLPLVSQNTHASLPPSLAKSLPKQIVRRENTRLPHLEFIDANKTNPLSEKDEKGLSFVDEHIDDDDNDDDANDDLTRKRRFLEREREQRFQRK